MVQGTQRGTDRQAPLGRGLEAGVLGSLQRTDVKTILRDFLREKGLQEHNPSIQLQHCLSPVQNYCLSTIYGLR